MHRREAPRMSPRMLGYLQGCLPDVCPDASPLPPPPHAREPPARHQASAVTRHPHASTGIRMPAACLTHASRSTGGAGVDLRCAADVLIHPPVPKKKAKWRIRGCGAHAVARGHRASDRTLCAPNGVLRGLVKVCQANLRGWGKVRRNVAG